MNHRSALLAAGVAFLLTGLEVQPGDAPHVSLVPWKLMKPGEPLQAPLVLFWVPASPEELRRSELLTSDDLTLYSSRCVAMRVVRSDDRVTLAKLEVEDELPAAILADDDGTVLARADARQTEEVEEIVRMELDRRMNEADELLDDAREKANAGETDAAVELYRTVWDQRCVCPRQGRDAQRALKKLKAAR